MYISAVVQVDLFVRMHFDKYELISSLSLFADSIEAEAKELILDIKYPATKKQVNI